MNRRNQPSIDIPAWIHFLNLHALQVIFDVERIWQLLFSAQWYRSGAFSFIDRRKKPLTNEFNQREISLWIFLLTLQASHVTAPKWMPDADAPQTRHGSFLYKSSVFGPIDSTN
jgi:hypothetical protein